MWRRWYNTGVFGLCLFSLCVGMTTGCAVFRATGKSVEAVGEGAGHAVAGLYMALVIHPRAFTTSSLAAYYYLFSAEGRVYRHFDELSVPGGDPSRFDFDAAQRADAVNSGVYSVTGNQLRIEMGRQGREVITTSVEGGHFKIGNALYERQ